MVFFTYTYTFPSIRNILLLYTFVYNRLVLQSMVRNPIGGDMYVARESLSSRRRHVYFVLVLLHE